MKKIGKAVARGALVFFIWIVGSVAIFSAVMATKGPSINK
jgi:hypothetical protein